MQETSTVAEKTKRHMGALTRTERRIAQVLLSQYPMPGLETLARFAAAAQTTAPSILRFTSKLGFASFSDFREALRDELKPQLQSALNRHSMTRSAQDARHYQHRFSDAVIANIRRARELFAQPQFDAVVDLLADVSRPIVCIGGRFSGALALSMHHFLAEMRPRVEHVSGQTANWPTTLLDVSKRHIVIAFDFRRYQGDVARFARSASDLGATLIVFTDEWMSGISRYAQHVIMAPVGAPSLYDSTIASTMQMEALIGALALRLDSTARRRIESLEKLRSSSDGPQTEADARAASATADRPPHRKAGARRGTRPRGS